MSNTQPSTVQEGGKGNPCMLNIHIDNVKGSYKKNSSTSLQTYYASFLKQTTQKQRYIVATKLCKDQTYLNQ